MKRFLYPVLWSGLLALLLFSPYLIERRTHAESSTGNQNRRKISKDILKKLADGRGSESVRVIVQPTANWDLDPELETAGGTNIRRFSNFPVRVVTLSANAAAALASRNDVSYVSLNRDVRPMGHVSATTGADQVRTSTGTNVSGLDGTGVGIAVIDSGIDTAHRTFVNKVNELRVVYSEDFTGEGRTDDPYGHGTHVASLAAGNGRVARSKYVGNCAQCRYH